VCEHDSRVVLQWTSNPALTLAGLEDLPAESRPRIVNGDWLKRNEVANEQARVTISDFWNAPADQHIRVKPRPRCEDKEDCGRWVEFGASHWRLVLVKSAMGGDCRQFACLLHDPGNGQFASPPGAKRWGEEAKAQPGACGSLQVDARRLGFLGQSLGALLGGVTAAMSSSMRAAVLNAGAADWLQILVDSGTAAIHCPLVDGLIAAGVLAGEPWNGGANLNATCLGEAWKTDRGFLDFAAAARWIWDPIDPVNFAGRYRDGRSVLLAEMVGDNVVPNSATSTWGTALGLAPELAVRGTPDSLLPSPAAVAPGSHWLRYQGSDADPVSLFPGNAYNHSSLLAPATPSASMAAGSGQLGTVRLQLDTVAYFVSHLGAAE